MVVRKVAEPALDRRSKVDDERRVGPLEERLQLDGADQGNGAGPLGPDVRVGEVGRRGAHRRVEFRRAHI